MFQMKNKDENNIKKIIFIYSKKLKNCVAFEMKFKLYLCLKTSFPRKKNRAHDFNTSFG